MASVNLTSLPGNTILVNPTFTSVATSDTIKNNGHVAVIVKSGAASSGVTVEGVPDPYGRDGSAATSGLNTGQYGATGYLPVPAFNKSDGTIDLTVTGTASILALAVGEP